MNRQVGVAGLVSLWFFAPVKYKRPATIADESRAMAKELKRRGFKFLGPTTCYALMQATGMVDDHISTCFRAKKKVTPRA